MVAVIRGGRSTPLRSGAAGADLGSERWCGTPRDPIHLPGRRARCRPRRRGGAGTWRPARSARSAHGHHRRCDHHRHRRCALGHPRGPGRRAAGVCSSPSQTSTPSFRLGSAGDDRARGCAAPASIWPGRVIPMLPRDPLQRRAARLHRGARAPGDHGRAAHRPRGARHSSRSLCQPAPLPCAPHLRRCRREPLRLRSLGKAASRLASWLPCAGCARRQRGFRRSAQRAVASISGGTRRTSPSDPATREPTGIEPRGENEAHRLVERLMVATNEAVAGWLVARGLPGVFRVHDQPTPDRVEMLSRFAHNLEHRDGLRRGAPALAASPPLSRRSYAVPPSRPRCVRTVLGKMLGPASLHRDSEPALRPRRRRSTCISTLADSPLR